MTEVESLPAKTEDVAPEARPEPYSTGPLPENRFLNRELSWLDFNSRVLDMAADASMPLLERAKFLAIFASNLDEFYMVRVAGLKRRDEMQLSVRSADGLSPANNSDWWVNEPSSWPPHTPRCSWNRFARGWPSTEFTSLRGPTSPPLNTVPCQRISPSNFSRS